MSKIHIDQVTLKFETQNYYCACVSSLTFPSQTLRLNEELKNESNTLPNWQVVLTCIVLLPFILHHTKLKKKKKNLQDWVITHVRVKELGTIAKLEDIKV